MGIALADLRLVFDGRQILRGLTASLPDNKFIGVIGPNGSGKSTMLKCIYRVLEPDGGAVYLDGRKITDYSVKETARRQAVLAQHNYYNFDFEVLDVVLMGRTPYKDTMEADNEEDYRLAWESLRFVGMEGFAHSNFSVLSGGEQQRVMLARALTQATSCLILDEPTNHLDIKYQLQLLTLVKKRGVSVVAAVHDLNIAAMYCDYILAMKDGSVLAYGTPQELLTADFIYRLFEVRAEVLQRPDGRLAVLYRE